MTIEDKIRAEKLQHDTNRDAANVSALSSGKIAKYEYLRGEELIPPYQKRVIEQATFRYSPLVKEIKTNKNNWRSRRKTKAPEKYGNK